MFTAVIASLSFLFGIYLGYVIGWTAAENALKDTADWIVNRIEEIKEREVRLFRKKK